MGEVERPQAGADRGDMDARRAAVLGRDVDRPEVQAPDVGRERVAPDDPDRDRPDRDRRDAILGRGRDTGAGRDAAAVERDVAGRDGQAQEPDRRGDILGRGRDTASERGQGRDRDRGRER